MERFIRNVVVSLIVLASSPAIAAETSRIERVTIYPGQLATLERSVRADLAQGTGSLELTGLASAIEPDSVRVEIVSGDLSVGAVETATEVVGEPTRERERELRQQIESLKQQRQGYQDQAATARSQLRFIEGLSKLPEQSEAAQALLSGDPGNQWAELWQRIGEGSRQAHQALRNAEREAQGLKKRIETLEERLDSLGESKREAVTVTIPYRAATAGQAELRVTYRVRGPEWQPTYEARLDTRGATLELVRSARVRQATGQDWQDVQLRLSTAQPVRGERPRPATWWIDLGSDDKGPQPVSDAARYSGEIAQLKSELAAAQPETARTVDAEFAATYEIPGRVSVPAGNQPRSLRIGSHTLSADVGATVYPQQDKRAWLTATASWEGDGPLPEGPMARFRDGAFVGEQPLATWSPGEERDLGFGVDPRVDVVYEPVRDEAGASGWINTQSTVARYYQLQVTNRHDRALPVTALFRVPVGRQEAIEVTEDFSAQPSERDIDDRRGVHRWLLPLDAGASKRLELGYRVAYPEDADLQGF